MSKFWTSQPVEPVPMPAVGKRGQFILRVWPDGAVDIREQVGSGSDDKVWHWPNVYRVDEFIGVLQHTRELGRQYFGEDWGK